MRLICPNCDAEYEVDDSAIPENGRDVQCSNCGHAWFQLPPEIEAALADEDALFGSLPDEEDEPPPPVTDAATEARRRTLDEDVLAVLREEAEREAAARRSELPPPIETQVEMEIPEPAPATAAPAATTPVDAAARRVARLKGIDPDARPVPPPKPGSRRELLPDIEEINSTLKPAQRGEVEDLPEPEAVAARASGFRSGFLLMLLIAAIGVSTYLMAPKLAAQIPGVAPALDAYVAQVDSGRLWLDDILRRATAIVQGLSERSAN